MNVNIYNTRNYENKRNWTIGESKPNSNPILSAVGGFRKAKMNVNLYVIEDYRKKDDFIVRINKPNSNPISKMPKMNANLYVIENYENEPPTGPKKTNPIKPNFTYSQRGKTEVQCRMSEVRYLSSAFCLLFSVFCPWAPTPIFSSNTRICPQNQKKSDNLPAFRTKNIWLSK